MNTSVCVSVGNKCYFFGKVCVRTKYKIPSKEPQYEFVAKYDKNLFPSKLVITTWGKKSRERTVPIKDFHKTIPKVLF